MRKEGSSTMTSFLEQREPGGRVQSGSKKTAQWRSSGGDPRLPPTTTNHALTSQCPTLERNSETPSKGKFLVQCHVKVRARADTSVFLFGIRALDAGHGVGEVIRGNFNDAVDNAGEGLRNSTNDSNSSAPTSENVHGRSADYNHGADHSTVAKNGTEEFKDGINRVSSAFHSDSSSTSTTTNTDTKSTGL